MNKCQHKKDKAVWEKKKKRLDPFLREYLERKQARKKRHNKSFAEGQGGNEA